MLLHILPVINCLFNSRFYCTYYDITISMQNEQEMTTFTIDVDMRELATRVMETVSALQDMQYFRIPRKLQIFSSIFVISLGGYAVMKRLFSNCCGSENAREREASEESEHGKLSSQLRFNLSQAKYRFQFDCKFFY